MSTILVLLFLSLIFACVLGFATIKLRVKSDNIVEKINDILPQTQCAQCGYPGCLPYAEAIANNEADINLCPPGGQSTIRELADLLGVEPKPLKESLAETKPPMVARVIEELCIGCLLCIKACPVDAISGTTKMMHTVIVDECTGCELCLEPCPMDCIVMEEISPQIAVIPLANKDRPIPLLKQLSNP